MKPELATDRNLRRILNLVLIVLASLSCYFLWEISGTAREIHQLVSSNSEEIEQIVSTASDISKEVDEIRATVSNLEENVRDSLPLEEVDSLLEETRLFFSEHVPSDDDGGIQSDGDEQIKELLNTIRKSDHRFRYGDQEFSPSRFYVLLRIKYGTYKRLLSSPEDFIKKVATKTIHGKTYEVLFEDGSTQELAEWLHEILAEKTSEEDVSTSP